MNQNDQHPEPTAPTLQPGVVASYKSGWQQLRMYWWKLLQILVILYVATLPVSLFSGHSPSLDWIFGAYMVLIIMPAAYGVNFAFLRAVRGHPLKINDMFTSFGNYWNVVLANILVTVIIGIGCILLIIPGVIFACKLAFTPYLVVDRRMEVVEAVKTSWRMTTGHAWKVFFIGLLGISIFLAVLICLMLLLGIILSMTMLLKGGFEMLFILPIIKTGLIWLAFMWIGLTYASLYHSVTGPVEARTSLKLEQTKNGRYIIR